MTDETRIFHVKAEEWYDNEWWDCFINITVDGEGKVVKVERVDD